MNVAVSKVFGKSGCSHGIALPVSYYLQEEKHRRQLNAQSELLLVLSF